MIFIDSYFGQEHEKQSKTKYNHKTTSIAPVIKLLEKKMALLFKHSQLIISILHQEQNRIFQHFKTFCITF
jgi:hypothetical protein